MTGKVIFTGCSYVQGTGLENERLDQNLWVNILHRARFSDHELVNLGRAGRTNLEIFKDSLKAISNPTCKHLVVSWSELYRYNVNPGLETYRTNVFWSYNTKVPIEININPDIVYNIKYLEDLRDRFFDLHHMHYEFVKILNYCNIIQNLCDRLGIAVYFVNCLVHEWDEGYFTQSTAKKPSDTTLVTQKILNTHTRNDNEVLELYNRIHNDYSETNGLPPKCNWLNIYHCYRKKFYVDLALDKIHPGIESNRQFAQYLINQLD